MPIELPTKERTVLIEVDQRELDHAVKVLGPVRVDVSAFRQGWIENGLDEKRIRREITYMAAKKLSEGCRAMAEAAGYSRRCAYHTGITVEGDTWEGIAYIGPEREISPEVKAAVQAKVDEFDA
jgi:hypothetical protein